MKSVVNHTAIVNGKVISDYKLQSGLGCDIPYEVVRMENLKILFFEDHLERFSNSIRLLGLKQLYSSLAIRSQIAMLVEATNLRNGNIRFQMIRTHISGLDEFQTFFIPHSYPSAKNYKNGVPADIAHLSRIQPQAKIQQQDFRRLTDHLIRTKNIYEIVLVDSSGFVTEGSRSNIFTIKQNTIYSAPAIHILPGITRKYVFEACKSLNFKIIEKRIPEAELFEMDAIFMTGTSPKVLPIRSIGPVNFDVQNKLLRAIMDKFGHLVNDYYGSTAKII